MKYSAFYYVCGAYKQANKYLLKAPEKSGHSILSLHIPMIYTSVLHLGQKSPSTSIHYSYTTINLELSLATSS